MRLSVQVWWAWIRYFRDVTGYALRRLFYRWLRCPFVGHQPKMALRGRCVMCGFDTFK